MNINKIILLRAIASLCFLFLIIITLKAQNIDCHDQTWDDYNWGNPITLTDVYVNDESLTTDYNGNYEFSCTVGFNASTFRVGNGIRQLQLKVGLSISDLDYYETSWLEVDLVDGAIDIYVPFSIEYVDAALYKIGLQFQKKEWADGDWKDTIEGTHTCNGGVWECEYNCPTGQRPHDTNCECINDIVTPECDPECDECVNGVCLDNPGGTVCPTSFATNSDYYIKVANKVNDFIGHNSSHEFNGSNYKPDCSGNNAVSNKTYSNWNDGSNAWEKFQFVNTTDGVKIYTIFTHKEDNGQGGCTEFTERYARYNSSTQRLRFDTNSDGGTIFCMDNTDGNKYLIKFIDSNSIRYLREGSSSSGEITSVANESEATVWEIDLLSNWSGETGNPYEGYENCQSPTNSISSFTNFNPNSQYVIRKYSADGRGLHIAHPNNGCNNPRQVRLASSQQVGRDDFFSNFNIICPDGCNTCAIKAADGCQKFLGVDGIYNEMSVDEDNVTNYNNTAFYFEEVVDIDGIADGSLFKIIYYDGANNYLIPNNYVNPIFNAYGGNDDRTLWYVEETIPGQFNNNCNTQDNCSISGVIDDYRVESNENESGGFDFKIRGKRMSCNPHRVVLRVFAEANNSNYLEYVNQTSIGAGNNPDFTIDFTTNLGDVEPCDNRYQIIVHYTTNQCGLIIATGEIKDIEEVNRICSMECLTEAICDEFTDFKDTEYFPAINFEINESENVRAWDISFEGKYAGEDDNNTITLQLWRQNNRLDLEQVTDDAGFTFEIPYCNRSNTYGQNTNGEYNTTVTIPILEHQNFAGEWHYKIQMSYTINGDITHVCNGSNVICPLEEGQPLACPDGTKPDITCTVCLGDEFECDKATCDPTSDTNRKSLFSLCTTVMVFQ